MITASSNNMATIMASSNAIAMIIIKTVINRVVVRPIFQRTLRDIITRIKGWRMIVAISNDMATIMASINAIAMCCSAHDVTHTSYYTIHIATQYQIIYPVPWYSTVHLIHVPANTVQTVRTISFHHQFR